jgi:hypothetical protein
MNDEAKATDVVFFEAIANLHAWQANGVLIPNL